MIILIAGATHAGKTMLAQRILEQYKIPYLSLDHLKMGLIRSGETSLTTNDDAGLTEYLWRITKEIIKTAIENKQNLTIEGIYIPFDWKKDFEPEYLSHIQYLCIVMTRGYIEKNFNSIRQYANIIEDRLDDSGINTEMLIRDNAESLRMCKKHGCKYILIDGDYNADIEKADLFNT